MASNSVVLILTEQQDYHADVIVDRLVLRGVKPYRFHTADLPLSASLNLTLNGGLWEGYFENSSGRLNLDTVHSAWYRRPANPQLAHSGMPPEAQDFALGETLAAMRGLWRVMNCFWVSHPARIAEASFKIEQLQTAANIGFNVPRTLVTNQPEKVAAFYEMCEQRVVYKTLWRPVVEHEDVSSAILTTPLLKEHLKTIDAVQLATCLFQEYIPKRIELRITVIGNRVFAVEIHSQSNEHTLHDWRHYDFQSIPHYPHRLPSSVEELCRKLVIEHYGLVFGAIDMIVTPRDEYVFLELNPNGQWAWLEIVTGLPLADAVADLLVAGQLV